MDLLNTPICSPPFGCVLSITTYLPVWITTKWPNHKRIDTPALMVEWLLNLLQHDPGRKVMSRRTEGYVNLCLDIYRADEYGLYEVQNSATA